MGLIKAVVGSAFTTLADMWQDYIYCDSMTSDVLVQKGKKKSAMGADKYADDNVITQGSRIAVNTGQTLIVVENGMIVDYTAEEGGYEFKSDAEPSAFNGSLDDGVRVTFEYMKSRFAYGGRAGNDQRAYFVNTKEITGNKFGFGNIPYRDKEFDLSIILHGYGIYSYRIINPLTFYTNIAGNVSNTYHRETLEPQIRTELQNALLPTLGLLSKSGIKYDEIPNFIEEIKDTLALELADDWESERGIGIESIALSSILPDDESLDKIRDLQESRIFSANKTMLGARLGAAQANAMEDAAKNPNGSVAGFYGMGMASYAGGVDANSLLNTPLHTSNTSDETTWICECGEINNKNYCSNCGEQRPNIKKCKNCNYIYPSSLKDAKFCPNCGNINE